MKYFSSQNHSLKETSEDQTVQAPRSNEGQIHEYAESTVQSGPEYRRMETP